MAKICEIEKLSISYTSIMVVRIEKRGKIHTTDVETGKEESNFEELVAKEGKDEAGDHEHDCHNGGADCDLADLYS